MTLVCTQPHTLQISPLHGRRLIFGLECRYIVGLFLFYETVNSQWHCDNILYPLSAQLTEEEIVKTYCQQCGNMTHTVHTLAILDNVFVDRFIFITIWLSRSLDLSPPDFFLGDAMKNLVFLGNLLVKHPTVYVTS